MTNIDSEKTRGHPYVKLMKQYLEDAKVSKTPWDKWECKASNLEMWQPLETHPRWDDEVDYRRKSNAPILVDNDETPTMNESMEIQTMNTIEQARAAYIQALRDELDHLLGEATEPEPETTTCEDPALSSRGQEWHDFASTVCNHIETYTVPQYGDAPDDQIAEWTSEQCAKQIAKYAARFGRNSRDEQDLLDMVKIAHYACLAYNKMKGGL